MKVAIFTDSDAGLLQIRINEWMESQSLGPADIQNVTQSESSESRNYHAQITITIWYIQHYERQDEPKRGRGLSQRQWVREQYWGEKPQEGE